MLATLESPIKTILWIPGRSFDNNVSISKTTGRKEVVEALEQELDPVYTSGLNTDHHATNNCDGPATTSKHARENRFGLLPPRDRYPLSGKHNVSAATVKCTDDRHIAPARNNEGISEKESRFSPPTSRDASYQGSNGLLRELVPSNSNSGPKIFSSLSWA